MTGRIFDTKKFAVHDGPGIRTTLFLKGCPLGCIWCHNPEGITDTINLWYFGNKCIQCRSCIAVCPKQALTADEGGSPFIRIDHDRCDRCGICVEECPTTALAFDGYDLSVEEAVTTLLQDREFYAQSGGGITLSGGDPLFQPEFAREVLSACKAQGIHTAMETSMQAEEEVLNGFIGVVDLFIVDLKILDAAAHRKYTGKDNSQILSNFRMLARSGGAMLVRIPLIPGMTATEENIRGIARFVKREAPGQAIELINFNPLAINKYRLMDMRREILEPMTPYSESELDGFYRILEDEGVPVIRETEASKQEA